MTRLTNIALVIIAAAIAATAFAATNQVRTTASSDERCIISNGLPDHETGTFPSADNPNEFSTQSIRFCVDRTPANGASLSAR